MTRRAPVAAAAAFLLLAAHAGIAGRAPDWVLRSKDTAIAPELLAGSPAPGAAVLWRQQIVTAASLSGASKLFERRAVKLLTPGGASDLTFHSTYDDDSKVDVEGAWTLHPDGKSESLDLDHVISVQVANAEYFSDVHIVAFRPPRMAPGDVAAYALSRKSRRDVYQWALDIQGSLPIASQEVAIDLPDGWTHRWRLTSAPDGYTGALSGEGGSRAAYPFAAQRPIPEEDFSGAQRDRIATLQIVVLPPAGKFPELVFQSWSDVGGWFQRKSLVARTAVPAGAVPEFAGDATRQSARWVQDHVRYVAIEVGEGGYVPRDPALVVRRLYGDCKDKAFLLMALLARSGIEALPVLTRGRDHGKIDPAFPSPIQFNHVVLAVRQTAPTGLASEVKIGGTGFVVFDPTDPWTPYGRLPSQLQGARGLVVRRDGAELIDLPFGPADTNRLTRTVEAVIQPDGELDATVMESTEGALSERDLYQRLTAIERAEMIDRFAERSIRGSHGSKLELVHLEEPDKPMEARFQVVASNYLRHAGALVLLPTLPFPIGPARALGERERRFPIELGCPRRRDSVVRLTLPPGMRVDSLPDPVEVENRYARYRFSAAFEAGRVVVRETFEVRTPTIPLSDLAAWRSLEAAAGKAAAAKAILKAG